MKEWLSHVEICTCMKHPVLLTKFAWKSYCKWFRLKNCDLSSVIIIFEDCEFNPGYSWIQWTDDSKCKNIKMLTVTKVYKIVLIVVG